jgi:hypothetical protein
MRGIISYIIAGAIIVFAMDMIAPPLGFGLAVFAWPAVNGDSFQQSVDRTHKSGRLPMPTVNGRQNVPASMPVLVGCDPVFSPLSASKNANYPGRCIG